MSEQILLHDKANDVWVNGKYIFDLFDPPSRPMFFVTICDREDRMGICMDFDGDGRTYADMLQEFKNFVNDERIKREEANNLGSPSK